MRSLTRRRAKCTGDHDSFSQRRYVARFAAILTKFDGRLRAADEEPEIREGSWERATKDGADGDVAVAVEANNPPNV